MTLISFLFLRRNILSSLKTFKILCRALAVAALAVDPPVLSVLLSLPKPLGLFPSSWFAWAYLVCCIVQELTDPSSLSSTTTLIHREANGGQDLYGISPCGVSALGRFPCCVSIWFCFFFFGKVGYWCLMSLVASLYLTDLGRFPCCVSIWFRFSISHDTTLESGILYAAWPITYGLVSLRPIQLCIVRNILVCLIFLFF